jgi:hypothetical protein
LLAAARGEEAASAAFSVTMSCTASPCPDIAFAEHDLEASFEYTVGV